MSYNLFFWASPVLEKHGIILTFDVPQQVRISGQQLAPDSPVVNLLEVVAAETNK